MVGCSQERPYHRVNSDHETPVILSPIFTDTSRVLGRRNPIE
jgi:hypothetical protein